MIFGLVLLCKQYYMRACNKKPVVFHSGISSVYLTSYGDDGNGKRELFVDVVVDDTENV